MAETSKARNARGGVKVQEFLRDSLEVAQTRLEALEGEAEKLFKEVSTRVSKASRQDWKELRTRVERIRKAGLEAAEEWKDRAETFGSDLVEQLAELQGRTMKVLGVASREEIEDLSREISKILKRLDELQKRRARRPAPRKAPVAQA
jgi:predicted site-specific integrase-resolvase